MTSGCFPYSALLGSTLDTRTASVYGAFGMYNAGFAGDIAPLAVFLGWQAHDVQHHEVDSRPALVRIQRIVWFDHGYILCVSLWRISRFYVKR